MQIERKIKKFISIAVVCMTCMIIRPAHAFVWFTIDIAEIASIINDVSNGIAKVEGAIAQIKNYTATIESIGNPAHLISKYTKELRSSLTKIGSSIKSATKAVENAAKGVVDTAKNVNEQITHNSSKEKGNTETLTKDVETAVNSGESEETVLAEIEKAKEDIEDNNRKDENILNQAKEHINEQTNEAQKIINELVGRVTESDILDDEVRSDLRKQSEQVESRLSDYNKESKDLLNSLQNKVLEKNRTVQDAYDEYKGMVQSYYKGTVKEEDLSAAGKKLNNTVQATKVGIDEEKMQNLETESRNISKDIIQLRESILDSVSNNKQYSDEDETFGKTSMLNATKNQQYAYHSREEYRNFYLKGIYADKDDEDKSFLLSYELGSDIQSKCKDLKFENIGKDTGKFIDSLRDCMVRAKARREDFCQDANAKGCDPYEIEERFKPYKEYGVYKHILQDYTVENITNLNKTKQYISAWLDMDNEKSTLKVLTDQIANINDQHNSIGLISMVNIEAPKLWSLMRRLDALMRAKEVVSLYRQQEKIYLNDDEYKKAEEATPGSVSGDLSENGDIEVISNGILYGCGAKGEEISLEPEDRYDVEKIEEAEKKIKDCFYSYAKGANLGTEEEETNNTTRDAIRAKWKEKMERAYNDSMFYTFALSTINNYKSSLDYKTGNNNNAEEAQKNIISLQENIKSSESIIDDYTGGAEIINYSTRQLLSIIDADAQYLQSEIIADLKTMGYDYFGAEE